MNENPYQPPQTILAAKQAIEIDGVLRRRARRRWQLATLILFLPAMNNLWLFENLMVNQGGPAPDPAAQGMDAILLAAVFAVAGLVGLNLLEWITDRLQRWLGSPANAGKWRSALYETVEQSFAFAVPGALLWKAWLIGIYQWQWDFQWVSIPIGILAHLLAAGLYLQLAYRWYKIESSNPASGN